MTKKRLSLLVPFETHKKLKTLSSETNQSMTRILIDCIDEKYVEFEKSQSPSSPEEPKFYYKGRQM